MCLGIALIDEDEVPNLDAFGTAFVDQGRLWCRLWGEVRRGFRSRGRMGRFRPSSRSCLFIAWNDLYRGVQIVF